MMVVQQYLSVLSKIRPNNRPEALSGGRKCRSRKPVEIIPLFITMPTVPSKMTNASGRFKNIYFGQD